MTGVQTCALPIFGYAIKYRKQPETAVVAFFGDGGTSEGDFHEAMNFAGLWRVPVVFICQNNHWAISVPVASQSSSRTLAQKAIASDIPALQVDGNDALALYAATRQTLQTPRSADRTTLVVTFQGSARELADALMLNTFDAFGIRVYDVSDYGLQVELIPQ